MTKQEAVEYVHENDDETADPDDLDEVFAALYERAPDAQDRLEGLWSHCCAAVD